MKAKELRAARVAAGLTQQQLADKAGFHRQAVIYWERKVGEFSMRWGAPAAFAKVLGMKYNFPTPTRARVYEVLDSEWLRKQTERLAEAERSRAARRRQTCGAKTRKGSPCRLQSEPGRRRCKYHGGMSTGPRTAEGKRRISDAQKKRWKRARA